MSSGAPGAGPVPAGARTALDLLLLTLAFFVVNVGRQLEMPPDDACISMVYARNWVAGHGPVYNPGDPVEGYTNFLWVMLLAGLGKLGLPIPAAAQATSVLLAGGVLVGVFLLAARFLGGSEHRWA